MGGREGGKGKSEMSITGSCLDDWPSADGTILRGSGSFLEVGSIWWMRVT